MSLANEITERVTMLDVYDRYGFEPNRAGFICCPFHNEKTPSLKVYAENRRWKCFGCGLGGSVIDFVMNLFSIDYRQAVSRINTDFSLGLAIGERPTYREQLRQIEAYRRIRNERLAREKAALQREINYWNAFDEWMKWALIKEEYAPKTPGEAPRPIFLLALQNLSAAEHQLDIAELERRGEEIGRGEHGTTDRDPGVYSG